MLAPPFAIDYRPAIKTGSLDIAELKRHLPEWEATVQNLLFSNQECSAKEKGSVMIHLPGNLGSASEQKGSPILTRYQAGSQRASEPRANQNYRGTSDTCRIS
jgi:hypothetical protein